MQELSNVMTKKYDEVIDKIKNFTDEFLNESYKNICCDAAKALFAENEEIVKKGKSVSWAAGIVHAIGSVNDLFDSKDEPYIRATELYKEFAVSSSTVNGKSKEIKSLLDISENNEKWIISKDSNNTSSKADVSSKDSDIVFDKNYKVSQKVIDLAWKQDNFSDRYKTAMQALSIYKDCADAYIILSTDPRISMDKKIKYLRKAVKAAENTLHITNMELTDAKVFAMKEAEPLFGARYLLAIKLWKIGDREKAIRNALQIVRYDRTDKMCVRGLVSSWLLLDNRNDDAKIFLENMDKDYLAETNYNRVAMFYRIGDKKSAEKALSRAFARNPFVVQYLSREKLIPAKLPKVSRLGGEEEAMQYATVGLKIWNNSEMVKWLTECKERYEIERFSNTLHK